MGCAQEILLRVENIEKYYGGLGTVTRALDQLSFHVRKGEYISIMGASGSGKTTLLNCLSTIDSVSAGHIMLDGKDITKLREEELAAFRRDNLGFVFQEYNLLDTLTLEENMALPAVVCGPKIIFADEPTGALDSHSARVLLEIISQLHEDLETTVFMVTHDAFCASYAERILFLKDGKIFNELVKGEKTRGVFYHEILDVLSLLGGDGQC